jgi:hypothetical protein
MWAAKHCSILFSSVLHQPERFLPCRRLQFFITLLEAALNKNYSNTSCKEHIIVMIEVIKSRRLKQSGVKTRVKLESGL